MEKGFTSRKGRQALLGCHIGSAGGIVPMNFKKIYTNYDLREIWSTRKKLYNAANTGDFVYSAS